MMNGISGTSAQWKMSRRWWTSVAAMLVALSVASVPTSVRAHDRVRIEGAFSVSYAFPLAVNYCGGRAGVPIQAEGLGDTPGVGALFLTIKKCYHPDETYTGRFTLSAGNGDAVHGTYQGTQGPSDANGFGPFGAC